MTAELRMDSQPQNVTQSLQLCKAPSSPSIRDGWKCCHKLLQSSAAQDGLSSLWNDFLGSLSLVYCNPLFSGRGSRIVLAVVDVTSDVSVVISLAGRIQQRGSGASKECSQLVWNAHLVPVSAKVPRWKWIIKFMTQEHKSQRKSVEIVKANKCTMASGYEK